MAFRVEPSAQAQQDLNDILEWLLEQGAGETGLRWFFGLEDAIASLAELPHSCPLAPENKESLLKCVSSFMGTNPISTGCSTPLTATW